LCITCSRSSVGVRGSVRRGRREPGARASDVGSRSNSVMLCRPQGRCYRGCSGTGLSDGCRERGSVVRSVGGTICQRSVALAETGVGQHERDAAGAGADGVLELAGGIFSAGVATAAAGVFSNGTVGLAAVVPSLFDVSLSVGGVLPAGGDVSTLPSMIGRPSL